MSSLETRWKAILHDECGVTSIEYAMLGALIAMVVIGSVRALGSNVLALYKMIAVKMPTV
ncbi:pilus assembly protein [Cupriavidus sp. UYMSc13B]|nr:pilus assembly protein [Cupriavidus sp. UYMSc13B]